MKLCYILEVLNNSSIEKIVELLNSATYIRDYKEKEDSFFIHIGFVFQIQTATKFELFFDLTTKNLIYQKRMKDSTMPCFLGIIYQKDGSYLKHATSGVLGACSFNEEHVYFYETTKEKIQKLEFECPVFTFFDDVDHHDLSKQKQFPLSKQVFQTIYFGNSRFQIYDPHTSYLADRENYDHESPRMRDNNDYDEYDSFWDATGGQVGDLGDEGWLSLGRE